MISMCRRCSHYLQVFFQPLILLEEKLQAKFKVEINLCGERDDVRWPQVPTADEHCFNDAQFWQLVRKILRWHFVTDKLVLRADDSLYWINAHLWLSIIWVIIRCNGVPLTWCKKTWGNGTWKTLQYYNGKVCILYVCYVSSACSSWEVSTAVFLVPNHAHQLSALL